MNNVDQAPPGVKPSLPELNSLIENGPFVRAQKVGIHGPEAVGKTTLATKFPEALLIDAEDGSSHLDIRRIRTQDEQTFYGVIRALAKAETLPCRTLVIDTIDAVEVLVRDRVLRIHQLKTIEGASYGSGWALFRQEFQRLLAEFNKIIARGVHVILISHAQVKKFTPPNSDNGYDRFEPKLYQPNAHSFKEWCDHLFFMTWDTRVVEGRHGKTYRGVGKNRVLYTQHCAAFDAKCRGNLAEKIPAEFDAISSLLGPLEKEVNKKGSAAADASTSNEKDIAPARSLNPELRDRLSDVDVIGDLDKEDVRAYLVSRKLVPEGGWLDDLSENQVKWIVEHVEKFRAQVTKFRTEPF